MTIQRTIPYLLTAFSLLVLVLSFQIEDHDVFDPSSAAFFPAVIGIVLVLCSVAIWRRGVLPPPSSVVVTEETAEEETMFENEVISKRDLAKRIIFFLIGISVFAFLMSYVNFMLLSFIYLFATMFLLDRKRWKMGLITSLISSAIIYGVFVYVFNIVFPS